MRSSRDTSATEAADAKACVAEMIAAIEQGVSPPALHRFLQEVFPRSFQGWLSRLVKQSSHAITRIVLFEDRGFFARSCVFEVTVSSGLLEGHVLPAGGSFGLFAVSVANPDVGYREAACELARFSYLSRQKTAVETLLRHEGASLTDADPLALARLFSEALGRKGNHSADVISSVDELASYSVGASSFACRYRVSESELHRVQTAVQAPSIVEDGAGGFRLHYCAVDGWMHDKTTLAQRRYRIDRDFRIVGDEQVILSRKIFSSTPHVRY